MLASPWWLLIVRFSSQIYKIDHHYGASDDGLFRTADFGITNQVITNIYDPTSKQSVLSQAFYAVATNGDSVWLGSSDRAAMGIDNGNGRATRNKVDPPLNQEVRVKLLKDKPFIGDNSVGKYYLYSVVNTETGEELAFFAPDYIHNIISEKRLVKDSEFILKKVPFQNGSKISSNLELSLVSAASPQSHTDNLKVIMRQCLAEAIEIPHSFTDVPFQKDDVRAICSSLFIARTR